MENFANALVDLIIEREKPRLENIMRYVADKIQTDVINETRRLTDEYYTSWYPNVYVRTDDYISRHSIDKSGRKHNKKGHLIARSKAEASRAGDVSLMKTMQALTAGSTPALGVCEPLGGVMGYQAGVLFDAGLFEGMMKHSVKGISEWSMVENFLAGKHGNAGQSASVSAALNNYIHSYQAMFHKHYNDAWSIYG